VPTGYAWVNAGNVSGQISVSTLRAEIGAAAAKSAIKRLRSIRHADRRLIPSHEYLEPGDIILSGKPPKADGKYKWHPISTGQQKYGCEQQHCHWTHAMLYVGELHVVESNKPIKIKTGVNVAALTRDAHHSEFLVLRYNNPEFKERRHDVVRYALMSPYLTPRTYDLLGAISSYIAWRPKGARHEKRIFCSEFILECFAIGGAYLVEDYVRITEQENQFFLPAHLAAHPGFDRLPMKYFDLVEHVATASGALADAQNETTNGKTSPKSA
jgi:hypothetical protein